MPLNCSAEPHSFVLCRRSFDLLLTLFEPQHKVPISPKGSRAKYLSGHCSGALLLGDGFLVSPWRSMPLPITQVCTIPAAQCARLVVLTCLSSWRADWLTVRSPSACVLRYHICGQRLSGKRCHGSERAREGPPKQRQGPNRNGRSGQGEDSQRKYAR